MPRTVTPSRRQQRVAPLAVAAQAPGWAAVAGAYLVAVPFLGVVSPVTWATTWTAWLYAIVPPCLAAGALIVARHRLLAAMMVVLAALPVAAVQIVGTIERTPSDQFHRYRGELAVLAADYRPGASPTTIDLPWRMKWLSIDGKAHSRCDTLRDEPGRERCVLYLRVWQNWRAENGVGFGYFPDPPAPDMFIATAAGDSGEPAYQLGDGWWWIE